jgi:NhaP-type Na+/H+ or K+/H+ antiporter
LLGIKPPGAQMIASVTFIAILMTILIQAPTTEWLGRRLGLLETSSNIFLLQGRLPALRGNEKNPYSPDLSERVSHGITAANWNRTHRGA